MWAKFRVKVNSTPDIDNDADIITKSTNLIQLCKTDIEKNVDKNSSVNKIAKLTANCGRQHQNLQRISVLYTAKYWGVNYPSNEKELNDAVNNFDSTLGMLVVASEITTIFQFQQSERAFLKNTSDTSNKELKPRSVCSTNLMFKDFNNLTSIY